MIAILELVITLTTGDVVVDNILEFPPPYIQTEAECVQYYNDRFEGIRNNMKTILMFEGFMVEDMQIVPKCSGEE